MLALRVLACEEISLLLTSFLSQHACWCLRHVARSVLSTATAPRVCLALHWRQELSELFTQLEVVLSSQSQPCCGGLVSLQDIRCSFAAAARDLSDARLGQLLAFTGELIAVQEKNGEPALGQRSPDGELRVPTFPELYARSASFETSLASKTEDLACNRVPTRVHVPLLPIVSKRRLSRQSSVILRKGEQIQEFDAHMKTYNSAKMLTSECSKWLCIVCGAESARAALEKLFEKGGIVTVERVSQVLASHRSTLRPSQPLPVDRVTAALTLLSARTAGGLTIGTSKKPTQQDRFCFQPFEGTSSARARDALQRELLALRRRYRQLSLDTQRAFTMLLGSSSSESSSSSSDRLHQDHLQEIDVDDA